ncbi:MAG: hypothetical protein CMK67_00620 [Pseudoalteromonas sp.]|uniref:MbcA/ParS/Xre antitoxin family protein n=1 Tax=Pseudoalteromonas TaxID=53246 RepID=UPI000C4B7245|nr:MbcA/ParS/Xre antitoxin family protein [Pseudoalteromonas sp.]MAB61638.1 hypothetical protein [Pseudoalteromonas sp.]|tara:strand:+ start:13494 stop:13937 length:444 start_codon:yes stop_codon:yes gene_type:complete
MNVLQRAENRFDFLSIVSEEKVTKSSDPLSEIDFIHNGVTKAGVLALAETLHWDKKLIAENLDITVHFLMRNKSKRLNKHLSENVLDIARLAQFGVEYFDNIDSFNYWLDNPSIELNGDSPRNYMNSILGRLLIKQTVNKLRYGYTV